jgi:asparagine synthase (glutamine-hydrolysing)
MQNVEKVYYKNDVDYLENFLDLYRTSVKNRLKGSGKTGISLSGGLDSGTVAILTAGELAKENKTLYSYTSVPLHDSSVFLNSGRFDDESGCVRLLCRQYPNIIPKFLNADNFSPLDGVIKTLDMLNQPLFAAGNMFSLHNLNYHASMDNVKTWLTGQGGNETISFSGDKNHSNGILDLLKNFEYLRLFYGKNDIKILLRTMAPEILKNIVRRFRPRPVRLSADWRNFSAINPTFAKKLDISDIQPFAEDTVISKDFRRKKFEGYFRGISADFYSGVWSEYGLRAMDPTRDRKLLEFCFGIPDDQYCRYGVSRFLVRRAFNGRMPDKILWNRDRGRQAADIVLRLKAESQRIGNIIDRLNKSSAAREILDLPKMTTILTRVQTENRTGIFTQSTNILLRGLMVGLFLLRHEGDKNLY